MPDIFDAGGVQRDWAWLTGRYGNVRLLDAGDAPKFGLVRIDCTEAPATVTVRVLNADGTPKAGQPVALSWPSLSAPDQELPDLTGGGLKTLWSNRGSYQYTEASGYTGFGIGTGFYISNLATGGPGAAWVLSPTLPSDGLSGIGMLGGTNHEGPLSLVFQVVEPGSGGGEEPGGGGEEPGGGGSEPPTSAWGCLAGILRVIADWLGAK